VTIPRTVAALRSRLVGAEHVYRVLIESMNEGALTLTAGETILYANQCFARMVKSPLEHVTGGPFRRFLCAADRITLKSLLNKPGSSGSKLQVLLNAGDGSRMPAQLSIRPLSKNGYAQRVFGVVVTDLTEVRRNEELLRALTRRVVQAQETERSRLAFELDDTITQLLCAVLLHSQALADTLPAREKTSKQAAITLRKMLGTAADEVERIARNLRPGVLAQLGLLAVLRDVSREFTDRTGVPVKLTLVTLAVRLPADTELTIYRILQESLRNVEQHAQARNVTVGLKRRGEFVELTIRDDGKAFAVGGLGLLGLRERASYVDGTFEVNSTRRMGTEIRVRIPLKRRVVHVSR
jgi:two-component system NarL family sensor kinase